MRQLKINNILVLVPAYSEFFLERTVEDAYKKAKYPDRLFFGIFNQKSLGSNFESFDQYPNVRCVNAIYEEPLGVGAARLNAALLHAGEEYICQIDAHTFFAKDWDEYYLESYKELKKYVDKPIISNSATWYSPSAYDNYDYQKKFDGDVGYPLTINLRGDTIEDRTRISEEKFIGRYQEHGLMYRL